MGGTSFAVECPAIQSGHDPFYAFDNNESTYFSTYGKGFSPLYVYNPDPLNITSVKIHIQAWIQGSYIFYGSNDYTNWEHIYTHNCHYDTGSTNTFSIPEYNGYFKYYQIQCQTTSVNYWDVYSIQFTGTTIKGNNILNSIWASPTPQRYYIKAWNNRD